MLAEWQVAMEWLDIVDAQDNVVRCMQRESYHNSVDGWIRCSAVLLTDPQGRLWVPTRAAHKELFPKCLDASACGHVQAGESYLSAALRETEEETGLTITEDRFQLLALLHPLRNHTFCFLAVFHVDLQEEEPRMSSHDHESTTWMEPEALLNLLRTGAPARPDLIQILKSLPIHCPA